MTVLNGIEVPNFSNHDEVIDFISDNSEKVYLRYLGWGEVNSNLAIVSKEANKEPQDINILICLVCDSVNASENICSKCGNTYHFNENKGKTN